MGYLRPIITVLKLICLWPYKKFGKQASLFVSILLQVSAASGASLNIGAAIYQWCAGMEDLNMFVDAMVGAVDYSGSIFIYFCFRKNLNLLQEVLYDMNGFLKYCDESLIDDAEVQVDKYFKLISGYVVFGFLSNCVAPLLHLESCNERRLSDYYRKHDPCGLLTRTWCPWDTTQSTIAYVVPYGMVFFGCVLVCIVILAVTMTLIGLFIHIIAQFENCKKHIIDIFGTENEINAISIETMESRLKFCIAYHCKIIRFFDKTSNVFNTLLIIHVGMTSFIFGALGYIIVTSDDIFDRLRYGMHLGGWISTLFLTCYYGQLMKHESLSVAEAAYNSKWYNGSPHLRKSLILLIMRSQRPLELKPVSLAVISLETFVSIVAVFGIAGACRRDELQKLPLNHINDMDSIITVKILDSKTNKPRSLFVISCKIRSFNFVEMYRKNASLRPQSTSHTRFFIRYYNGKCSHQPVGINNFSKISISKKTEIAAQIQEDEPSTSTGNFTTIRKRVLSEKPEIITGSEENTIQKNTGNEVYPSVTSTESRAENFMPGATNMHFLH